jgi:hypothetical protein
MNTKAVVAARDVQRVLANVHEALHDEVRVLKSARSKRAADDAVRRIHKCNTVLGQALAIQNGNISKIRDAASSSYVMKSQDVERRRKERQESGGTRKTCFDSAMDWAKDAMESEAAEAITPSKSALSKERVLDQCRIQHQDSGQDYITEMMELDPQVSRTAEDCVRMLAAVPPGSTHCVAQSWHERGVITMGPRGIVKRVAHLKKGDTQKAFKPWFHGAGQDGIVPLSVFDEWVLSHRAAYSVGKKDVKE